MTDRDAPPGVRNPELRRLLPRLIAIIVVAIAGTLGLVWYLWEGSPKPP